ncbi:hypothetical protein C8A05DRAFT_20423 [Staphylotrichum tortipilum]|uniref:Uncharacterized protein n=1 Tax=Staphylotrichum tortipilum TaxID=2831512 RepID=A0AAN6MB00_9PEZI|nr:hypothetical protein C8A05DRAFT_20423 [Staphylotrichum longicolle]
MWESIDDPAKRREIRYGNNIYLLFRALLHCRRFYGQDNLWQAVARGFNTNSTVLQATAEILTKARRAQRSKPSKDVSDTAMAADDWIQFLDSRPPHPRGPPDPEVHKVAEAFFKDQGKKLLNAARVPINGRAAFRHSARGPVDEMGLSPRLPPSSPMKLDSPREPAADRNRFPPLAHKRSASPHRDDRSPKFRRFESDGRPPPRNEPDRHGALDELPMIQPTRSPPRPTQSGPAQALRATQPAPPTSPRVKREPAASRSAPMASSAQPAAKGDSTGPPAQADRPAQPRPQENAAQPRPPPTGPARTEAVPKPAQPASSEPRSWQRREGASGLSIQAAPDDRSALHARIASLERQLTETKAKLGASLTATTPTTPSIPIQLVQEMAGLKRDMGSATNAIGTMMESMHDIVDSLNSLQDEVSALATQQKEHLSSTAPPPAQPTPANLDALLAPLDTLTTTVTTLRADLATLKATTTPPTPSPSNPTLESLLQAQSARMDKLAHQLANVQASQAQLLARPQGSSQGQPQTLRQAMAAAERDLRHHLGTVQQFYHHTAAGGGVGASRAVTERTADLLATLSEGVRVAQAGAGGGL